MSIMIYIYSITTNHITSVNTTILIYNKSWSYLQDKRFNIGTLTVTFTQVLWTEDDVITSKHVAIETPSFH